MNAVPILAYHSIDDSGSVVSVAPALFRAQMDFLAAQDFRVLPLDDVTHRLAAGKSLPNRALAITFDDGFRNNYTEALPALERHGFPAAVFVIAGRVGSDNDWPGQPPEIPRLPLLSWEEMDRMTNRGITFGAHTMRHLPLTLLPPEEALAEMRDSQSLLAARLGQPVRHFAFPYGAADAVLRQQAATLFDAGFSTRLGLARSARLGGDVGDLDRVDAYYIRPPRLFALLARPTLLRLYLGVRGALREARSRALPGIRPFVLAQAVAAGERR